VMCSFFRFYGRSFLMLIFRSLLLDADILADV